MAKLSEFERLLRWSELLGWDDLRNFTHIVPANRDMGVRKYLVSWYRSGDDDVFLQINKKPDWRACVYAIRYRICTGWHCFFPYSDIGRILSEAKRLSGWLSKSNFDTAIARRRFRLAHPKSANYTWGRIRNEGAPNLQ